MTDGGLPVGTVTLLLTDLVGSTRLWERDASTMSAALAHLDHLVADAVGSNGGVVVKPRGEGDSHFCAFARASDAARAAVALCESVGAANWRTAEPLQPRMAIHTGEVELRDADYYGPTVNRAARLRAIGHGGQILLSGAAADLVRPTLLPPADLRDLGRHRLRDLADAEHVFELRSPASPEFAPLLSLDARLHNLPVQLTSFIGRTVEKAELIGRIGETRLVTLTGVGGCGKTRLALEVAAELVADFPDGAWFVDLSSVSDPAVVLSTIAAVVGVRDDDASPGRTIGDRLVAALRERTLLLVVDNCEHLIAECAAAVVLLLQGCPGLKVLATSREALGVPGESIWFVPSLPSEDAARLFKDRASLRRSSAVDESAAAAVTDICEQLDGIPLAIELAAAKVTMLSPAQIAAKLGDRFRLLAGGGGASLPRQQTLHATVDWSHDLLSAGERATLRRLSVFAGGFSLDAADAVCAGPPVADGGTFEVLSRLVDKCLVQLDPTATEPRYRMLETVRQYAAGKLLESAEVETSRQAHQAWYCDFSRQAHDGMHSRESARWFSQVATELDNLRGAMRWEGLDALRIAVNLRPYWFVRGPLTEGAHYIESQLSHCPADDATLLAEGEAALGQLLTWAASSEAARPHVERAVAAASQLSGERPRTAGALALTCLAHIEIARWGAPAGVARLRAAVEEAEAGAATWMVMTATLMLAHREIYQDRPRAQQLIERVARDVDDCGPYVKGLWAQIAADLAAMDQRFDDLESMLEALESLADETGSSSYRSSAAIRRAALAHLMGRGEVARQFFADAIESSHVSGHRRVRLQAVLLLSIALADDGEFELALAALDLEIARERADGADGSDLAEALVARGEVCARAGDLAAARRVYDEALGCTGEDGTSRIVGLTALGELDVREGHLRTAAAEFQEAVRLLAGGPVFHIVSAIDGVVALAEACGDEETAGCLRASADAHRHLACCWAHLVIRLMREQLTAGRDDGALSLPDALAQAEAFCQGLLDSDGKD